MLKESLRRRTPLTLIAVTVALLSGCNQEGGPTADQPASQSLQRSKDFEKQGSGAAAIIEAKNAVQAEPENVDTRLQLAQTYIKSGNGRDAEHQLMQAADLGAAPRDYSDSAG